MKCFLFVYHLVKFFDFVPNTEDKLTQYPNKIFEVLVSLEVLMRFHLFILYAVHCLMADPDLVIWICLRMQNFQAVCMHIHRFTQYFVTLFIYLLRHSELFI